MILTVQKQRTPRGQKEKIMSKMKKETHAIRQNGKITDTEWLTVEEAYALIAEFGDRVAESYTVYAGENDCPVGECFQIYDEGETVEDYPDGDPHAETITIFYEGKK